MWWCCGKTDYNAPGCKVQKHSTRDDKGNEGEASPGQLKQVKCLCCKEYGHQSEECPKDPNYRSNFDVQEEDARLVNNMKEKKKLNSDSQMLTLKMLTEFSKNKNQKLKGVNMMQFEDFQYNGVNEHILDLPDPDQPAPTQALLLGVTDENNEEELLATSEMIEDQQKKLQKMRPRLFNEREIIDIEHS